MTPPREICRFEAAGTKHALAGGDCFRATKKELYRDTDPNDVRGLIESIRAGTPWIEAVRARFAQSNPWLARIVTDPRRKRFFEELALAPDSAVLDVGAGWGQISLPLAATHRVCALEPTPERLDFIAEAAASSGVADNLAFVQADYLAVGFATRFDLIVCNGVLEWVGRFSSEAPGSTQRRFLAKMRGELAEGGRCIIGIENRLGLKYLLGAPDDHTGERRLHEFDAETAATLWKERFGTELRVVTYTLGEYRELFREAGFTCIRSHAAFPDYKLPEVILPIDDPALMNQRLLEGTPAPEHSGRDGAALPFERELSSHYRTLATLGIAHFFAPSFFFELS